MTVQLSTGRDRNAELAAGVEKAREIEVKRRGGCGSRDVVATWTGCFQPRRRFYFDCRKVNCDSLLSSEERSLRQTRSVV